MAVRPIDGNALHAVISAWPESIMYKDWVQSAIATAPTLTPPNEWVSVEERLPETRDDYIVFTEDAEVFLCDYIPSVGQWWNGDDLILDGRITCWMPLPAPPDRRPPEGEV